MSLTDFLTILTDYLTIRTSYQLMVILRLYSRGQGKAEGDSQLCLPKEILHKELHKPLENRNL